MSASVSGEVRAEPNLTPLLDVVFQLITFFMLVFNMSADNYDQRVRLPVAGEARPAETGKAVEDKLIFNIDREGRLLWNGQELDTERAIKEIRVQAQIARRLAETAGRKINEAEGLPTTIVIRSDRATPFYQFLRIITACQANGFRKFALKAMNKEG